MAFNDWNKLLIATNEKRHASTEVFVSPQGLSS